MSTADDPPGSPVTYGTVTPCFLFIRFACIRITITICCRGGPVLTSHHAHTKLGNGRLNRPAARYHRQPESISRFTDSTMLVTCGGIGSSTIPGQCYRQADSSPLSGDYQGKGFADLKAGDRVRIKSFNGTTSKEKTDDYSEDYWKLLGETGTIQQDPYEKTVYAHFSQQPRVLVRFDKDLMASYGLYAHNNIENSLWILISDMESL